jgi:NAD(P)-dependent dehydrogenase (short-subunit alcohol dehydrogenase family)
MADKTALVVGASRGIGLGLVKELASRGWSVIATFRTPASDKGLKAFADGSGGKVRLEVLDMEDSAGIDALANSLSGETFDLLFVNAGISGPVGKAIAEVTHEEVAKLFVTNTVAPVHLAQALAPRVRDKTGVIALMTSGLGSVAQSFPFGIDLYCGSKAALNRLTRALTQQLDGRGLTVLSVSPGWVRTDMGGPNAAISVDESAKGCIDLVESKAGSGAHGFYGHDGHVIPW